MKGKELIRLLQEIDPTGEVEVSVGNIDIWDVHQEPAYWDGKLQLVVRDPAKAPYYDIVGGKYVVSGSKIVISTMSIADVLWSDPEAAIDYSELGQYAAEYRKHDDATRQASRDVTMRVEVDSFARWVAKQCQRLRPGCATDTYEKDIAYSAAEFFKKHLSPDDPLKALPPEKRMSGGKEYESWPSVNQRRESDWDDRIEVYWRGGWGIKMKDGSGAIED
ncbi:MAG: hypothetical protein OK454_02665 [Thaumarchaeota archaeon]|nr:hypothetical protein [Nitrososphaerota archaeon]